MDRKQMCVANVQYKKSAPEESKRARNLLRYLTYRGGRHDHIRQVSGRQRWMDHGMGGSLAEVARKCEALKSEHVLMFSLIINPNPDLSGMVPPEQRESFVRELTEQIVEGFFDARGLDTGIEWSSVLHHRDTDDLQAPGRPDPHTHVVLPGTVYDEEHGKRVPLFFSRNRKVNHIALLHEVTEQVMVQQLERYIGPDWEQRYDALASARDQAQQIVQGEPHGYELNDEQHWPLWCGTRPTDENTSAVGTYRHYPRPSEDDPDALRLEFRPLVSRLSHDEAQMLAEAFAREMQGSVETLRGFAEWVNGMSAAERAQLVEALRSAQHAPPDREL